MVSWFKPMSVCVQCEMNTRNFPWDRQTCMFAIGSFNYFDRDIQLNLVVSHPQPVNKLFNLKRSSTEKQQNNSMHPE